MMIVVKPDFGSNGINTAVLKFQEKNGRDPSGEELQMLISLNNAYLLEVLTDKMTEAVNILDRIADRDL